MSEVGECFDDLLRALGEDPERLRWEREQERLRDLPAKRAGWFLIITCVVVFVLMTL